MRDLKRSALELCLKSFNFLQLPKDAFEELDSFNFAQDDFFEAKHNLLVHCSSIYDMRFNQPLEDLAGSHDLRELELQLADEVSEPLVQNVRAHPLQHLQLNQI